MSRVYLDHNATTPVDPEVFDAMLPYFSGEYGNASSIHTFGQKARAGVETAREQVAALLGARPQEIVFTSGGTEADNHAIFGIAGAAVASSSKGRALSTNVVAISSTSEGSGLSADDVEAISGGPGLSRDLTPTARERLQPLKVIPVPHIIATAIEHEAVLNTCQALEKRGISVTYLPVDRDGQIDLQALHDSLREHPETVLITAMHANNELGTVQPLEEIGQIAAEADVYFHTDAVQSVGKIPIDVSAFKLDLLSLSGHKLYAPKGIGALYIRGGTRLRQLLYGGHHQRGFRPGTENVAGIVGLGKAAQIAKASLAEDAKRVAALRDTLEHTLLQCVPDSRVNGAGAQRTPNTTNITFPGIEGEALVIALDLKGLACSTGAACSSGAVEPSHVLTAIGLPAEDARASLRFSLGRHTTAADIDFALEVIPAAVAQLRELSPTYRKPVKAEAHP
jgi:cysteine desulfurase